jgi:hypothetical protein
MASRISGKHICLEELILEDLKEEQEVKFRMQLTIREAEYSYLIFKNKE